MKISVAKWLRKHEQETEDEVFTPASKVDANRMKKFIAEMNSELRNWFRHGGGFEDSQQFMYDLMDKFGFLEAKTKIVVEDDD